MLYWLLTKVELTDRLRAAFLNLRKSLALLEIVIKVALAARVFRLLPIAIGLAAQPLPD